MIVLAQAQGLSVALPGGVNLAHQDHGTPREAGGPRRGEAVGAAVCQPFPLVAVPIFFWNTGNLKLKQSHLNAKAGRWGLQQGLKQSCRPGTPKAASPPPFSVLQALSHGVVSGFHQVPASIMGCGFLMAVLTETLRDVQVRQERVLSSASGDYSWSCLESN